MAQKLKGPLPPNLDLPPSTLIQITAVDATTGADIPAVVISNVAILATTALPPELDDGLSPVSPLFVPVAADS